jgi:hypothetical protein
MRTLKISLWPAAIALGLGLFIQNHYLLSAQAPAAIIIENSETPKYSGKTAPRLVLKQELSIPLVGRRYSFDVDDEGTIYLLESLESRISVYANDGKLIAQFGRKGQGPGEFDNSVYLAVSKAKKIFVLDRARKAIQLFDLKGNPLEQRQLSSMGAMNSLKIDSQGSAYIQDMRNLFAIQDEERIRRGLTGLSRLAKFNSRFEKVRDVETWDNRFGKRITGEYYPVLYHDVFYYQVAEDDCLYIGDSSRYEIRQLTSEGPVKKIIRKKANRIRTTNEDRANYLQDFPELKEAKMAEMKPFFLDFHVLDKIGLLVGTYEDEWNGQGVLLCDLFDQGGVYVARVEVPGYYYSKDQDLISEQRNRMFKNGCSYSIIYDEKNGALELVRHSVELKWSEPAISCPSPGCPEL